MLFETRRLIHARFCVTGAPEFFLANVQGPWIHPDAMDTEELPPVNLLTVREAGPYAVHAPIVLEGAPAGFWATLCRCGFPPQAVLRQLTS